LTFKGSYDTPDTAVEVALSENYAYVADRNSGLQIIALNSDKLTLSGTPNSVGTYGVDIKACNEIMECVTDSFDIVVMDLSTILVIIGSSIGACVICTVSLCLLLTVGGGIVILKRHRKGGLEDENNEDKKGCKEEELQKLENEKDEKIVQPIEEKIKVEEV